MGKSHSTGTSYFDSQGLISPLGKTGTESQQWSALETRCSPRGLQSFTGKVSLGVLLKLEFIDFSNPETQCHTCNSPTISPSLQTLSSPFSFLILFLRILYTSTQPFPTPFQRPRWFGQMLDQRERFQKPNWSRVS